MGYPDNDPYRRSSKLSPGVQKSMDRNRDDDQVIHGGSCPDYMQAETLTLLHACSRCSCQTSESQCSSSTQRSKIEARSSMPGLTLPCILIAIIMAVNDAGAQGSEFVYDGFKDAILILGGASSITRDGILSLTSGGPGSSGHGFHAEYIDMGGGDTRIFSFSTTFVFAKLPYFSFGLHDEMVFLISSTTDFFGTYPDAVFFALVLGGTDNNSVCIRSSSMMSDYCYDMFQDKCSGLISEALMGLTGGEPVQLSADYNGTSMELNVTLALVPIHDLVSAALLSCSIDLRGVMAGHSLSQALVGFSASTGDKAVTNQVFGWSFNLSGQAQPLNYSLLPLKAVTEDIHGVGRKTMRRWLPATVSVLIVLAGLTVACLALRCHRKNDQVQEEGWEAELGPRRFLHKELRKATNGFSSSKLLGQGAFGSVYGGVLAASSTRIAVKRISSESKYGLEQFMAEVVILGRLRHRNLVRLIGYCRHKEELLLVYEHMPNGSLDRYLHIESRDTLAWSQRFHVIKGVALGLLYLHEDWEQVIVHRDIKASNVLLDAEMNGRLGDFGLARLHDHGADAHTTHVAGTRGYLAPELLRLGKATRATDVFAFGAFILEVACGRRPLGLNARGEPLVLMEWVPQVWASGGIVYAMDPRLQDYATEEAELVLKLGLLCSHPLPAARPGMRLVMEYLDGDVPFPEFLPEYLSITDQVLEKTPSVATTITGLSGGR